MKVTKPVVLLGYPKIDHEENYVYYWMPFSTMVLAGELLKLGHVDVILFDGNRDGLDVWKAQLEDLGDRLLCVGLSIMTGGGQISHALEMAEVAKSLFPYVPIVYGGPHVNVLAEQTAMHPLVDAVLVGPGQRSMPVYVNALLGTTDLLQVPGYIAKGDQGLIKGPPNPPRAEQLGSYPWHLLDVPTYIRNDPTVASRTLNYVSSQGCVYLCRFCYELTYNRKYSRMTDSTLVNEIEWLVQAYGLNGIKFYDADWFIDLRRAVSFASGLLDKSLDVSWAASINPNDVLKARVRHPTMLKLAAESGLTRLLMGVESGSDRVLKEVVRKEVTRDQIIDVANEIASNGILGSYTFIIGFPGETESEIEETLDLIRQLWTLSPRPETRVHIFAPYPGTPLFEASLAHGFEAPQQLEDWATYDYYKSLTPWTTEAMAALAREYTDMRLTPDNSQDYATRA